MTPTEAGKIARSEKELIEVGAEAAHDSFYYIRPETSASSYMFAAEDDREEWRAAMRAAFRAIGELK
jgi:hypothetical protein